MLRKQRLYGYVLLMKRSNKTDLNMNLVIVLFCWIKIVGIDGFGFTSDALSVEAWFGCAVTWEHRRRVNCDHRRCSMAHQETLTARFVGSGTYNEAKEYLWPRKVDD